MLRPSRRSRCFARAACVVFTFDPGAERERDTGPCVREVASAVPVANCSTLA
jgi:hypothetical protein